MNGIRMMSLAGMLAACGLLLAVRALRPAPPSLVASLALLNTQVRPSARAELPRGNWDWLPPTIAQLLDRHLSVPDTDLRVIGWTRSQLAARKVALAVAGFLTPAFLGAMALLLGLPVPFSIPAVVGLALGGYLWTLPSAEVRENAAKSRAEFRDALDFFLDLVALERLARGSVTEALESASEISGCGPFVQIHAVLERAALAGQQPWTALRDLGDDLDVQELRSLGDVVGLAADGAAVYKTLLAEGRSLRHAGLADARRAANEASERMSIPVALLTIGLAMFVFVPLILRMVGVA